VHARLRLRAARAGHSVEAEVRRILERAVQEEPPPANASDLRDLVADLYGGRTPEGVVDGLIRERRDSAGRE